MLRYAIPATIVLVAGNACAQTTTPSSSATPKAVVSMEQPKPGDHWTYQERNEITGKIVGTRENIVTEVTPDTISLHYTRTEPHEEGLSL